MIGKIKLYRGSVHSIMEHICLFFRLHSLSGASSSWFRRRCHHNTTLTPGLVTWLLSSNSNVHRQTHPFAVGVTLSVWFLAVALYFMEQHDNQS